MVCYAMWVGHHPYETPPRHAAVLRRDHAARAVADDDCSTTDSSDDGDDGDDSGEPDTEVEAAASSDLPGTPFKIMLRVSNGERPALPRSMPLPLRALVAACWAHDPADRPSIAAAVGELDALRNEWEACVPMIDAAVGESAAPPTATPALPRGLGARQ